MTTYLIGYLFDYVFRSGVSLVVLLGMYRLLLENQPMHRLKRIYLLGTLLLSLAIPVVSLQVPVGWLSVTDSVQLVDNQFSEVIRKDKILTTASPINGQIANAPAIGNIPDLPNYWLWVYAAGTLLMLVRFTRNLFVLLRQVWANPTEPYHGATLVKLPGPGLHYTFLNYLFVPAATYERGEIENELFTHELAHIRQCHSLDVLLIEMVLCFGWFNPLLFWLKKAMQRNHEFLADQAVNETYLNVPGYQRLLMSKLTTASPKLSLTSTLTFQTTKQRLTMMTKQTSSARTCLAGCSTVVLFASLTLLLAGAAPAQQLPAVSGSKAVDNQPVLTEAQLLERSPSVAEMEQRFGSKVVLIRTELRREVGKDKVVFKDLTPEQKMRVIYIAPGKRKPPTEAQWADFSNAKKYGVWVDSKRRRDDPFSKIKRTDIVAYSYSFVHKNARQPEGYLYQLSLETEAGYQKDIQVRRENPILVLETKERADMYRAKQGK